MYKLQIIFLSFFIYSIIGWICEMICCNTKSNHFVNRGFLIGPYCPIYGVGAVIMTLLIKPSNDVAATFLKAMAICSILEYITSVIMEKLFQTRWWDYSTKNFNLNGRICLQTMILFGIGGVVIIEWANPIIFGLIYNLNQIALTIIATITFVIFMTDLIVSYNIINGFKKVQRDIRKDSTEEVTKLVRKTLKEKNYFSKRLVYSFPDFKSMVKKYDKKVIKEKKKLEKKIEKEKQKLKKLKKKQKYID